MSSARKKKFVDIKARMVADLAQASSLSQEELKQQEELFLETEKRDLSTLPSKKQSLSLKYSKPFILDQQSLSYSALFKLHIQYSILQYILTLTPEPKQVSVPDPFIDLRESPGLLKVSKDLWGMPQSFYQQYFPQSPTKSPTESPPTKSPTELAQTTKPKATKPAAPTELPTEEFEPYQTLTLFSTDNCHQLKLDPFETFSDDGLTDGQKKLALLAKLRLDGRLKRQLKLLSGYSPSIRSAEMALFPNQLQHLYSILELQMSYVFPTPQPAVQQGEEEKAASWTSLINFPLDYTSPSHHQLQSSKFAQHDPTSPPLQSNTDKAALFFLKSMFDHGHQVEINVPIPQYINKPQDPKKKHPKKTQDPNKPEEEEENIYSIDMDLCPMPHRFSINGLVKLCDGKDSRDLAALASVKAVDTESDVTKSGAAALGFVV
jgi:hypothetical protein